MTVAPARRLLSTLLLAATALAGCGGGEEAGNRQAAAGPTRASVLLGPAEPAAPPVATAAGRHVQIALDTSETARGTQVSLPGDVLFGFDEAVVHADARPTLAALAALIAQRRPGHVLIEGHSDAVGNPLYNLDLSRRRARAVRDYLVAVEHVPPAGLTVTGLGARGAVASERSEAGRARNRRVVVVLAR